MLRVQVPKGHILIYGKKNLRRVLREAANTVAREARTLTRNAAGGGRAYSTPKTISKGIHYASAPGEPPAMLTGMLNRSITTKIGKGGESISIRDNQFYAKFLEVGAKGGAGNRTKGGKGKRNVKATKNRQGAVSSSRVLEPRPFISRALDDQKAEIERKILEAVKADIEFK